MLKRSILIMGLMIACGGLLGCSNPCRKMSNKLVDCMEAYCAEHGDEERCKDVEANAEAIRTQYGECSIEESQRVEALLGAECSELADSL